MLELHSVPLLAERLRTVRALRAASCAGDSARTSTQALGNACADLQAARERLRIVLAVVLTAVSYMNSGKPGGRMRAIDLRDLLKLKDMASNNPALCPSLLHFVANEVLKDVRTSFLRCADAPVCLSAVLHEGIR